MRPDRDSTSSIGGLVVFLTLGVGLTLLFFGVDWFWIVFVLGFAVVLPMVGILTGDENEPTASEATQPDPLETLRERYARGEIDEAEFERRLDRLLDTESPQAAKERLIDETEPDRQRDRDRESAAERS
ncbi:MAG: SHOCT domain-containing protein [Halobacteriales archaeon]|nr:SHOCT domain-containing protein [Halobacteriales archaeon]